MSKAYQKPLRSQCKCYYNNQLFQLLLVPSNVVHTFHIAFKNVSMELNLKYITNNIHIEYKKNLN